MKVLGLLGGTSYLTTAEYYAGINRGVSQKLGGADYPTCLVHSINLGEFRRNNYAGDIAANAEILVDGARRLEAGGAEALVLCANGLHEFADEVTAAVPLPLIHIGDAIATAVRDPGYRRVGLLGLKPTMNLPFIRSRLTGVEVILPDAADQEWVHASILEELTNGVFADTTRQRYLKLIKSLESRGAEAAILACTEIPMLLEGADIGIPTLDTLKLHIEAAVDFLTDEQPR